MFHPELTPKERISRLEGAYEQVNKRLREFGKSISELRYPHRARGREHVHHKIHHEAHVSASRARKGTLSVHLNRAAPGIRIARAEGKGMWQG